MTLENTYQSGWAVRQHIPQIGRRYTLKSIADYRQHCPQLTYWSWLTVRAIGSVMATVEHYNAGDTGEMFEVPIDAIKPPIGWAPKYTIHCTSAEQATTIVREWFSRGIVVRASHDLGNPGATAFQPLTDGDAPQSPHWRYVENTDVVAAELCPKVFRVVHVEEQDIGQERSLRMWRADCPHCKGTGRRTLAELAVIRKQSVAKLKQLMTVKPEPYSTNQGLQLDAYDAETETFECGCHWGAFREMGRSKRAKLIKQWRAEGWTVEYRPYAGGFWIRTRETIVHNWAGAE